MQDTKNNQLLQGFLVEFIKFVGQCLDGSYKY